MSIEQTQLQPKKEKVLPPFEIKKDNEALEYIKNLYEKGIRPIVTVPRQYAEYLRQGLKPHATWIGIPLIAATFGREPFIPRNEDRIIVEIRGISINQIRPRFTGPNNSFSGVVVLEPPIPPENIKYNL
ncbi:MAG: hypothetical protein M3P22_01535 [bacterium]|nr:hypothetical protein [bacterium]